MKHRLFFSSITILLLIIPSAECTDTVSWGGHLGGAYWHPDWSANHNEFDSASSGLWGPSLFLYYKNFGAGFQYYSGNFKLTFPEMDESIKAGRTDMDIILSYRVSHYLQLSALYKNVSYDWDQTFSVKSRMSGFGFGAGMNHILPRRILLYGYGFYLPGLDYSQEISWGSDLDGTASGYWLEAGFGYVASTPRIIFKVGYRHQRLSIDVSSRDWTETTSGLRADISYYF
jgi:hypothetical protein